MIILRNFFTAIIFGYFLRAQLINLTGLQAFLANILIYATFIGAYYLGDYKELILFEVVISGLFVLYLLFIESNIIIKEIEWFKILFWFILLILIFPFSHREYKKINEQEKQISNKK
ncbi:MAG: hypothetical protein Q4D53_01860 [Leptotrichiaceae bacterium]|nr:hypothetical protein [Leptotrichiaceae bacterium]